MYFTCHISMQAAFENCRWVHPSHHNVSIYAYTADVSAFYEQVRIKAWNWMREFYLVWTQRLLWWIHTCQSLRHDCTLRTTKAMQIEFLKTCDTKHAYPKACRQRRAKSPQSTALWALNYKVPTSSTYHLFDKMSRYYHFDQCIGRYPTYLYQS